MKLSRNREAVNKWRAARPEWCLWNSAKQRSKKQGLEFYIEVKDIVIPSVCPVFGVPLINNIGKGAGPNYWSPTVDRKDNLKGYIKENIQVISWKANVMKHGATNEELKQFANWVLQ